MSWIVTAFALLGLSILAQSVLSNAHRARIAILFQLAVGATLVMSGVHAYDLAPGVGESLSGPTLGLAGYRFDFTPTLYLDARNGLLLAMLGLVLPLVFFWLRESFTEAGAGFFVSADLLTLGLVGAFVADSLLLFYVFFEVSLIGAYFWIGLYGTAERNGSGEFGTLTRFLLFTLVGSLAMLVSIALIVANAGTDVRLSNLSVTVAELPQTVRQWSAAGFFLAFAVKMPLFLFHGWMRETYRGAPAAARAILSAGMSKLGAYGFLMILVPGYAADLRPIAGLLQVFAVIGVGYGALMCFGVKSFRDVLIYSSLTHLNLIALGVFTAMTGTEADSSPLQAALFQMFNHGLLMGALFALESRIARDQSADHDFGGLRARLPRLAAIMLTTIFVAISLPGTGSFAAELLILFAAYRQSLTTAFLALVGLLIAAAALVRVFHRNFLGEERGHTAMVARDLSAGETAVGLGCIALWIVTGFYPMWILGPLQGLIASL